MKLEKKKENRLTFLVPPPPDIAETMRGYYDIDSIYNSINNNKKKK